MECKVDGVKVFGLNKDLKNFIKNKVDRVIITTTKISSLRLNIFIIILIN